MTLWRSDFPNPKDFAFSWHQNDIDGTSSVLASWKIEFSESETYRFVAAPREHVAISVLPTLEHRNFRIGNKSPFHGSKATFKQFCAPSKTNIPNRKEISFLLRESKVSVSWRSEKANFPNPKEIAFSWRQNTLSRIPAFWCLEKLNFPNPKQTWSNFLCFDAMKKRVFRIRTKSLFHGAKKLWRDFQLFGALKEGNFTNVKEIAFSWR